MTASRARIPEPQRQPRDRQGKRLPATKQVINRDPQRQVKRLPRTSQFPLPLWLKLLVTTQKLAIASTVLLTVAVFAIYGWTVYAQEQWNQQYKKLEQLKRQERQLTNATGAFDNERLQSIQNKPGELVRERPEQSLFLQAAPLRPKREVPATVSEKPKQTPNESLGY